MLDLAKQLGGKVDGSLFTGGGKPGRVYIQANQIWLDGKNITPVTELQLEDCEMPTAENSYFKSGRRKGLYEAFQDM